MLEIRQNIATREWVIISTERARRPEEFVQEDTGKQEYLPALVPHCPFCPGNEELEEVLRKIYFGLNDPDYNYIIRSAPEHEHRLGYLHWYVSVIPRVTRTAGFEMGSGMFINTTPPEDSARFLREVTVP